MAAQPGPQRPVPRRQLTLFDSTCIIVGIMIGAGIYETTPLIAQNVPGPLWLIGVWLLGGGLSLIGALCYGELTTAYPREGGDYVFLSRAFGRVVGFLFAWSQLWVVRPGSLGAMAYIFGRYANQLWPGAEAEEALPAMMGYAVGAVVVLTLINIVGVREGKWTQNLLTVAKLVGLAVLCLVGFSLAGAEPPPGPVEQTARLTGGDWSALGFAMILVLYTYGGWNEMAYVGAELKDPRKNVLRALILGTVVVTAIYVATTLAFLYALGFTSMATSGAVAADVLELGLGHWGARAISLLIAVSALGAINGMIFTGARIYYAMGSDHRAFGWLGRWSSRRGTPVWSLVVQALITLGLIVGFGLYTRGTKSGFQSMVEFTTPIFWVFFLLVGLSLFVLRWKEPDVARPYRVAWYPITPMLFCLSSLAMLYASLAYAIRHSSHEPVWAVGIMLVGLVLSLWPSGRKTEP